MRVTLCLCCGLCCVAFDAVAANGPDPYPAPGPTPAPASLAAAAPEPVQLDPVIVRGRRPDGYLIPDTTTATRTDTPLIDIPQTIQVISAKLLRDQAAQSLDDAMRNAPGVSVHQGEGNRDQIVIRGVSTKSDFFVNGVRDDSERFRDLYNVAHVDVLQGPAAVLFGRGGAGGIVNVVTRQPTRETVRNFDFQTGAHDDFRATADLGGAIGASAAFRLDAMGQSAGSYRDHFWLRRYAIDPELGVTLGNGGHLEVGVEHTFDNRLADRGIPSQAGRPVDVRRSTFFGSVNQNWARVGYDAAHIRYRQDLGEDLTLRETFRVAHTDHVYQNLYPGSAVAANDTLSLKGYWHKNIRNSFFSQTELVDRFDTGRVGHTLLLGLELGHQHDHDVKLDASTIRNVPLADPTADGVFDLPSRDNLATGRSASLYAEDQLRLGEHWKALAGIRFDRFDVDASYQLLPGTTTSHTDHVFSPRAGLIWQPVPNDSVYISYSRSFTPQGSNLALSLKSPVGANLGPEKATNYEIGNKLDLFNEALSIQAAVFRLNLANLDSPDPNDPSQLVQIGRQRNTGAELTVNGRVTRAWHVYADYTYLGDAKLLDATTDGAAGARAGLVPRNQFSIWTTYALGSHWGIGGGLHGNSRQYASFTDAVVLPGYVRTDLMGWYQRHGYRVQLNIDNVFNRRYYGTANGDNQIMPGGPTTVFLSVRAEL